MKNTLRAQRIALDFCKGAQSGLGFSGDDAREALAVAILGFIEEAPKDYDPAKIPVATEDRIAAIELSMALNAARNKKSKLEDRIGVILNKAQDILDWDPRKKEEPVAKKPAKAKRGRQRNK